METEFKQEYINIGTPLVMNKTEKKKAKYQGEHKVQPMGKVVCLVTKHPTMHIGYRASGIWNPASKSQSPQG